MRLKNKKIKNTEKNTPTENHREPPPSILYIPWILPLSPSKPLIHRSEHTSTRATTNHYQTRLVKDKKLKAKNKGMEISLLHDRSLRVSSPRNPTLSLSSQIDPCLRPTYYPATMLCTLLVVVVVVGRI